MILQHVSSTDPGTMCQLDDQAWFKAKNQTRTTTTTEETPERTKTTAKPTAEEGEWQLTDRESQKNFYTPPLGNK